MAERDKSTMVIYSNPEEMLKYIWDSFMSWDFGPTVVNACIVLDVLAAVGYALHNDWKKVVYWGCASGLTIAVKMMH